LTVIWIHTAARKIEKMKTGIRWILRAVNEGWGRRKMRPPSIIALKTESIAHHENSSIESGLTEDAPCVEVQSAALGESSAIRTKVGGRVCSTSFLRMVRHPREGIKPGSDKTIRFPSPKTREVVRRNNSDQGSWNTHTAGARSTFWISGTSGANPVA
jgi:hypothetical protein